MIRFDCACLVLWLNICDHQSVFLLPFLHMHKNDLPLFFFYFLSSLLHFYVLFSQIEGRRGDRKEKRVYVYSGGRGKGGGDSTPSLPHPFPRPISSPRFLSLWEGKQKKVKGREEGEEREDRKRKESMDTKSYSLLWVVIQQVCERHQGSYCKMRKVKEE